jgi:predicted cupin superfamily sugar epimerase
METNVTDRINSYVQAFHMQPHPEGGFYASTYRSREYIPAAALPDRFPADRLVSTAIYFLLAGHQFSAFHRIKSDELWHFYDGCGLEIYVIHPDGRGEVLRLGRDIAQGYAFQQLVPAGCWFASRPVDSTSFCLVGCTVAPGFDFEDFELANCAALTQQFPAHRSWIEQLTR